MGVTIARRQDGDAALALGQGQIPRWHVKHFRHAHVPQTWWNKSQENRHSLDSCLAAGQATGRNQLLSQAADAVVTVPTCCRCWLTSAQVSCSVETGAPLSSNWPPGSSVTLCPSSSHPMMWSAAGVDSWVRCLMAFARSVPLITINI